jgi:hypothetical protein
LDIDGWCPIKLIIVTKHLGENIITTLRGTNISEVKEGCNDDDDDDTNISDESIEAPNDNDYHEPRPQNPNLAISHPPKSRIIRVSQS